MIADGYDLSLLDEHTLLYLDWQRRWADTARPNQLLPDNDIWSECGFMAGRGFGKTRIGAEWLGKSAYEDPSGYDSAVIAPTQADVRFTCMEGESGLLSVIPPDLVVSYNSTDKIITMRNIAGGTCNLRGFSAERPERLRGPQHCRGWCFAAGTMVNTEHGAVPIERLRPGDMVLTRCGPRAVLANSTRVADVGLVAFSNGASLVGTTDHPVYTPAGWTDLGQLRQGDQACAIAALSGAAGAGTSTPADTTSGRTRASHPNARFACTARSGRMSTALSQPVTTCITLMKIAATTILTTLNSCRTVLTAPCTASPNPYPGRTGAPRRSSPWPVRAAVWPSSASDRAAHLSVDVAGSGTRTPNARLSGPAPSAALASSRAPGTSAASVVSTWRPMGQQSVYCLKVAGEPEYFANGILVHNCDELAAWLRAEETWDMYLFGLRLGHNPQTLWTTTPRPRQIIRRLTTPQPNRIVVRGTTYDNKANLPLKFYENVAQYEGTKIGRQELHGELIDPEESGIIKRSHFQLWPATKPLPYFDWIIMSLDTAFTEKSIDRKTFDPDPTACGVWGVFTLKQKSYIMLLDCWEEHLGMPDLIKRVKKELKVAYGMDEDIALVQPKVGGIKPITSGRKPDLCIIEDKGSGISLRQMLDREGITTYPYNPGNADKLARLHMVSHIFVQRRVFLPESQKIANMPRTWCEPLVAQLCSFLGEGSIPHDDHVDQCTQAIRLCIDKGLLTPSHVEAEDRKKRLHPELAEDVKPPKKVVQNPYAQ